MKEIHGAKSLRHENKEKEQEWQTEGSLGSHDGEAASTGRGRDEEITVATGPTCTESLAAL